MDSVSVCSKGGSLALTQGRRSRSGWSGQNRTTFLDLKCYLVMVVIFKNDIAWFHDDVA